MDFSHIEPLNKDVPFEFGPIQIKWLEALESGEYKQADGRLWDKPSDSYCCLGVAAKLAGIEWQDMPEAYDTGFVFGEGETLSVSNGFLPVGAADVIGLRGPRGDFAQMVQVCGSHADTLANLNDHYKLSFADIAAYIRHDPHNVFKHAA